MGTQFVFAGKRMFNPLFEYHIEKAYQKKLFVRTELIENLKVGSPDLVGIYGLYWND